MKRRQSERELNIEVAEDSGWIEMDRKMMDRYFKAFLLAGQWIGCRWFLSYTNDFGVFVGSAASMRPNRGDVDVVVVPRVQDAHRGYRIELSGGARGIENTLPGPLGYKGQFRLTKKGDEVDVSKVGHPKALLKIIY